MNILKSIPKLRRKSLGNMFISEGFEPPVQLQATLQAIRLSYVVALVDKWHIFSKGQKIQIYILHLFYDESHLKGKSIFWTYFSASLCLLSLKIKLDIYGNLVQYKLFNENNCLVCFKDKKCARALLRGSLGKYFLLSHPNNCWAFFIKIS